jgi:hypothetical protein
MCYHRILASSQYTVSKKHKVSHASQKIQVLRDKGDISDSLLTPKDDNLPVNVSAQTFCDQLRSQIPNDIIDMMFMISPMPMDNSKFS